MPVLRSSTSLFTDLANRAKRGQLDAPNAIPGSLRPLSQEPHPTSRRAFLGANPTSGSGSFNPGYNWTAKKRVEEAQKKQDSRPPRNLSELADRVAEMFVKNPGSMMLMGGTASQNQRVQNTVSAALRALASNSRTAMRRLGFSQGQIDYIQTVAKAAPGSERGLIETMIDPLTGSVIRTIPPTGSLPTRPGFIMPLPDFGAAIRKKR